MKHALSTFRLLILAFVTSMLFACASTSVNYTEYMAGQWNTEIQGFPVTVEYTDNTVGVVGFGEPIPYTLKDDTITFDFQGIQTSTIVIVNDNEMTHTNVDTELVTTFKRAI